MCYITYPSVQPQDKLIMPNARQPLILIVLDGWGYNPKSQHNAIAQARTPHWDKWWDNAPKTLIHCDGPLVGLPEGQMGNSEVGHMHIGAGRIIEQDLTRINKATRNRQFFKNEVLRTAITKAKKNHRSVHIIGLLSPGGVHSHEQHIYAMAELVAQVGCQHLWVHALLDGRDTPPKSAESSLTKLKQHLGTLGIGKIASIIGRYYAMDRDNRWDRTQQAYQLIVNGKACHQAPNAQAGLALAYERGESDEFVQPTTTLGERPIGCHEGDVVIFMNFRSDRARQLTRAIIDKPFNAFQRVNPPSLEMVTLTEYAPDIKAAVAFLPLHLGNMIGMVIAQAQMRQLRIAETEKYAHVTFFFNGGIETYLPNEQRILIPSPKVSTYDQQPEMSAYALTEKLITAIESRHYEVIICNFANADMLGHTGNFAATMQAIECLDQCLVRIYEATQRLGGEILMTADHGNAETMFDDRTNQPYTAHTQNPVPFIYLGRQATVTTQKGSLIDIAPTMLYLLGLEKPKEMTGKSLLKLN